MSEPHNQDSTSPPDPGTILRTAREARGLTLEQAANELHVDTGIISGLEHNDFSRLDVPTFVKGHLRNYARLLDLDATALIAAYEAMEHPRIPELVAFNTGRHRSAAVAGWVGLIGVILVAVLLLLTGLWWTHRSEAMHGTQSVSASQPGTLTQGSARKQDKTIQNKPAKGSPQTGEEQAPPQQAAAPPLGEPSASVLQPRTQLATAGDNGKSRITLDVTQASWVEVSDSTNTTLYYDLAPAGKALQLDGVAPFKVFLGNSPGVHISVNGRPFDQSAYNRSDHTARFVIAVANKKNAAGG